jgi:quinol monooxygenase YgiN
MPEALILEFNGVSEADYEAVSKQLGIDVQTGRGDWPAGLLSHAAGTADDGLFVVSEVWSSRAAQESFLASRLGAAFAAVGLTAAPTMRWVPLLAYHRPDA